MVLAWRSRAGPARSTRPAYVDEAQVSFREPCCSHQSARPLPESGSVRSITIQPVGVTHARLNVETELEQAADLRKRDEINSLGRIGAAGRGASWLRP